MGTISGVFRGWGLGDSSDVAPATDSNPIGAIRLSHIFTCPDATNDYDLVLPYNFEVTDVEVVKTIASVTTASAQIKNLAAPITQALALGLLVGSVVQNTTVDTTASLISAGGTLRVSVTKVLGNAACKVFVNGIKR